MSQQPTDQFPRQVQPQPQVSQPSQRDSHQQVVIGLLVVIALLVAIGLLLRVWTGNALPMELAATLTLLIVMGWRGYEWIRRRLAHDRNPV